jgi:hypothetical protein
MHVFALGACSVCGRASYAQWPVLLRVDHEFVGSGYGISWDELLPAKADYARIADTVMALLADPDRSAAMPRASAAYFDAHVALERIALYLLDIAE